MKTAVLAGGLSTERDVSISSGPLAKGALSSHYFETKEQLIENLPQLINKGDVVLVKASHSMAFEKIVQSLKELKADEG